MANSQKDVQYPDAINLLNTEARNAESRAQEYERLDLAEEAGVCHSRAREFLDAARALSGQSTDTSDL